MVVCFLGSHCIYYCDNAKLSTGQFGSIANSLDNSAIGSIAEANTSVTVLRCVGLEVSSKPSFKVFENQQVMGKDEGS